MQVFLQHAVTRKYLRDLDVWTSGSYLAMEFDDSAAAIQFCLDHELRDMRVVLHFPEFDHDVHVPVNLPLVMHRA